MNLHECLSDSRRYQRQIERLRNRYLFTRHLYESQQAGVSLASLSLNQSAVAKLLARTVERGEYQPAPARIRKVKSGGKERVVFACRLTDLIVHGVVAEVIEEATAPTLSPGLYSYRKGVSWWAPISGFAAYLRAHRKSRPDPRTRGIYVLRRDVDSYTDSIPVGGASPLWPMLRAVLAAPADSLTPADWRLIQTVIRPSASVEEGTLFTRYRGVPTGRPISCVLFNLYLAPLDSELDGIPGAFYARYCDDILFAHPDPQVARAADSRIQAVLSQLWLGVSEKKSQTLYLTAAGRPSPEWLESEAATAVPFLGCLVSAHGIVSLSREKRRRLLADLKERALRTVKALGTHDPPSAGPLVCAVINRALEGRADFCQQRSVTLVRKAVTDRHHLKQLDYWIARITLRAITGRDGARAFRAIPYRTIREDWKLISLLHARNKWPDRPD